MPTITTILEGQFPGKDVITKAISRFDDLSTQEKVSMALQTREVHVLQSLIISLALEVEKFEADFAEIRWQNAFRVGEDDGETS